MLDGSYARGYASPDDLGAAVRDDFTEYLKAEWRSQINSIWSIVAVRDRSPAIVTGARSLDDAGDRPLVT